ncbi:MAG: hypothetical protein KGK07_14705 [Chloroflexota bacterium]|nr:hypothetical protein [Chloroflexota bacterium]
MTAIHNDACNRAQQAARDFEAAHLRLLPRTCGGAGAWYDAGVRYHRDGSSGTPPDGGAYDACVGAGKCPLCAQPIATEEQGGCDYGRCAACGWDEHAIATGAAPLVAHPDPECLCWLEEEGA